MRKYLSLFLVTIFFTGIAFVWWKRLMPEAVFIPENNPVLFSEKESLSSSTSPASSSEPAPIDDGFYLPLDRANERVTKKPFGIYINSKNSPVQPERFSGFHTGTDFEIFPEELNSPVEVRAVCDGELILKKTATGYGGVVVQSCTFDSQPVTVVYGHLKLSSVAENIGEELKAGDALGQLGADNSAETDGERKHLHLGIHQGVRVNLLGYVQTEKELAGWIDPCQYVCW